jgi:uncharacterized short protein YbdD (DUF466 family)
MRGLGSVLRAALSGLWSVARALSGDSAYETYLAHARRSGGPILTREEFYLDSVGRRYSRVSRCC